MHVHLTRRTKMYINSSSISSAKSVYMSTPSSKVEPESGGQVSQLTRVLSDHLCKTKSDGRLTLLEQRMLEAFVTAFDPFSAGTKLWTYCMQIGAEITGLEAATLAKQQKARGKRLQASKHRAKAPNGLGHRQVSRPVRRAVMA